MTRKSPTNDDDTPQEAVQSYLDLMLKPATAEEVAEPQVSQIPERAERTKLNKASTPLAMVGGTAISQVPVARRKRHGDLPSLKPYAEPVKPLTLKMPLSTIKPEVSTEAKAQQVPVTNYSELAQSKADPKPESQPQSRERTKTSEETLKNRAPLQQPEDVSLLETEVEPEVEPEEVEVEEHYHACEWLENGRPSWAQERFECLLFTVGGLTLAVPLSELGTIYPLDNELTPIFGQADWFLGLLSVKGVNIRTVNTAKVVMPERYDASMAENFSHVITIDRVDWGLAVDSVSTAITLTPDDVRWRTQRSKRPWLAGTVVEKMCALLDVSQLAAMFVDQDIPRP